MYREVRLTCDQLAPIVNRMSTWYSDIDSGIDWKIGDIIVFLPTLNGLRIPYRLTAKVLSVFKNGSMVSLNLDIEKTNPEKFYTAKKTVVIDNAPLSHPKPPKSIDGVSIE